MAWIWTLANALKFNLRLRHTSRQRRPTQPTPPDIVDRHGDLPAVKGIKNDKNMYLLLLANVCHCNIFYSLFYVGCLVTLSDVSRQKLQPTLAAKNESCAFSMLKDNVI